MSHLRRSDVPGITGDLILDTSRAGQFRHVILLSIPTGGQAETAQVRDDAVLDVRFLSRTVNALPTSAVEPATLAEENGDLVLRLAVAREVRRVKLRTPIDADRVAAYRFDGSSVAEDPVVRRTHGTAGATLNVTDSQLILRRRNGVDFALSTNEIAEVQLRYTAVNPRLALRVAGEVDETPFPVKLDSDGVPDFPTDAAFGPEFAQALTALIAGLPAPLPDPLRVELILLADQPCRARVDRLSVSLDLETTAMAQKAVLHFAGGRRHSEHVALSLPTGSQILGGTMSLTVTGTPAAAQVQTSAAAIDLAVLDQGVHVTAAHVVASRYAVTDPVAVASVEVALCVPSERAVLCAEILSDDKGLPGDVLATSAEVSVSGAAPNSISFRFAPVALPAGDIWIGLRVKSGTIVAMLGPEGALARAIPSGFAALSGASGQGMALAVHPVAGGPSGSGAAPDTGPRVTWGDMVVPGIAGSGTTNVDLAGISATLGATEQVIVSSALKATVTLDPIRLRYSLMS